MFPSLHVFGIDLSMYGIMMIVGMAAAIGIVVLRCGSLGYPRQEAILTGLIAIAGGIAGAVLFRPITKLPEIIIHWEVISKVPLGEFLSWFIGELVFFGGLIGGCIGAVLYCRAFKMRLAPIADVFAPAIPVGHAFGRVGCFFAGCCYGVEVSPSNPFAVVYPPRTDGLDMVAVPAGVPILAVPLIEAGVNILIACFIVFVLPKRKVIGRDIGVYGILYSVQRFVLEFFRGDKVRGVYWGISTSQFISIALVIISTIWLIYIYRKARRIKTEIAC